MPNLLFKYSTRKPVGFMQSWKRTSRFKSHLFLMWNFSNLSWRVAYLKLSDETWNEMCYLKLFNPSQQLLIWNFQMGLEKRNLKLFKLFNHKTGVALFETFRWDLKQDMLFETFWTWNFSTHHRSCLFETFRWDLKQDVLFQTFKMFETV